MVNVTDQSQNNTVVYKNEKLLHKLDCSPYNKSNMDNLTAIVAFLEKKNINYVLNVVPVMQDDRKLSKRKKKVINNNKYILFNSWYTKIKQVEWPNSPAMWDLVKTKPELADFVFIFDHTEKLGKNLANRSAAAALTENTAALKKKQSADESLAEYKENGEMRDKLYFEFYNVLNETFNCNTAPTTSHIYDNLLTRDLITKSMLKFKTVALKLPVVTEYVPTPIASGNKKRKRSSSTSAAKQRSHTKVRRVAAPSTSALLMVNDDTQDTNMSE